MSAANKPDAGGGEKKRTRTKAEVKFFGDAKRPKMDDATDDVGRSPADGNLGTLNQPNAQDDGADLMAMTGESFELESSQTVSDETANGGANAGSSHQTGETVDGQPSVSFSSENAPVQNTIQTGEAPGPSSAGPGWKKPGNLLQDAMVESEIDLRGDSGDNLKQRTNYETISDSSFDIDYLEREFESTLMSGVSSNEPDVSDLLNSINFDTLVGFDAPKMDAESQNGRSGTNQAAIPSANAGCNDARFAQQGSSDDVPWAMGSTWDSSDYTVPFPAQPSKLE